MRRRKPTNDPHAPPGNDLGTVVELRVLEGKDSGREFTIEAPEVLLIRSDTGRSEPGQIALTDPTVSSRQALIRLTRTGAEVKHNVHATNPTLVNGRSIQQRRITTGDRLQAGRVVIEVRVRAGRRRPDPEPVEPVMPTQQWQVADGDDDREGTTEVRKLDMQVGALHVIQGPEDIQDQGFPLKPNGTTIGRGECDVQINDRAVSRMHAELRWEGANLVLLHRSQVNPTFVNERPVLDRAVVNDGDVIRLADRISLRLSVKGFADVAASQRARSLRDHVEDSVERDREIEESFGTEGCFLDIDVVQSSAMKRTTDRAAHIVVSFERFRAFVEAAITEFSGMVLNSNGDEIMAFFDTPLEAVHSGSAILSRLEEFNRHENLLRVPFRFRMGVHAGRCLVDRNRGVAYSEVLDVAGHLQKEADPDGMLVSQAAFASLPEGLPFAPAGNLDKDGMPFYRLTELVLPEKESSPEDPA